ncbi:MAG: SCO family protein [Acidobacteriota bacterium]
MKSSVAKRFLSGLASMLCFFTIALAQQGSLYRGPDKLSQPSDGTPKILRDIGIDQRLNEQVPLDLEFRDEAGETVQLSRYIKNKPVIIVLVYYQCPLLCNQILGGLGSALRTLSFDVGKEFEVVTVSFDARETPEMARERKARALEQYNREGATEGWHFLTGDQASIDRLCEAVGFKYTFDRDTNQFAHAAGIMVITPQGRLARYFYGFEYPPKDLKFGLMEASENRIGSAVDKAILYCYRYDPMTGKYGVVVMRVMQVAAVVTVIAIIILLLVLRRTNQRRISAEGAV